MALNIFQRAVSTVTQHFRAQFFFPGPAVVILPLAVNIADLSGSRKSWQLTESSHENRFIARTVVWLSECPPDGMIDEGRARRRDFAHDVESRADYQSRNAASLDNVGDETDGLVAERSIGYEQSKVHRRTFKFRHDSRR